VSSWYPSAHAAAAAEFQSAASSAHAAAAVESRAQRAQHMQRPQRSPERSELSTRSGRSGVQSAASSAHAAAAAESRAQRAQHTQRPRFAPASSTGELDAAEAAWVLRVRLWTGPSTQPAPILPGVEKFCRCGLRVLRSSLRSGLGHLGRGAPPGGDTSDPVSRAQQAQRAQRPSPGRSERNRDRVHHELGVPLSTRSGRSGVQSAASSTHAAAAAESRAQRAQHTQRPRFAPASSTGELDAAAARVAPSDCGRGRARNPHESSQG